MSAEPSVFLAAAADTIKLGEMLGRDCRAGDVILLAGELGGGKTTLTRGIALGLEVGKNVPVTSPTFNIVHEYQGRLDLFHFDLYRLSGEDELFEIGFDDYLDRGGVCVIEWPDRLGGLKPRDFVVITLEYSEDFASRKARFTASGGQWLERIRELTASFAG